MDAQQLVKLKKLKDKGMISEEEFNAEKKKLLNAISNTSSKVSFKNVISIGAITLLAVLVIGGIYLKHSSELNFACDESTMKFAEDLINKTYTNFNNTFRLSNPVQVNQSKDYLKCKVETNFYREFPEIYYELDKQSDGTILVHVNPYGDKIQQEIDKAVQDFEQEMMHYSY